MTVQFTTLVELTRQRAQTQTDDTAYTFLVDGEADTATLTYAELDRRARAIAASLQQWNAASERALLIYPPGLDYIAAFLGCLYAGVVAVPTYPPRLNRPDPRLQTILADSQATIALTTGSILASLERRFEHTPDLASLRWLNTEQVDAQRADNWAAPTLSSDMLAFLQYTSGSTSSPRGVMLTHDNLLHNLSLIHQSFEVHAKSVGVIWLPPYHDMGLIGGILEPLYGGFPVTLMAPVAFLQRPLRWLQAISKYGGTISGGPNFSYEFCTQKISPADIAALDLSTWDVAFTGAEPIQPDTLDRFATAFAPGGFRREAFYPCYGLAETTLIVSGGAKAELPIRLNVKRDSIEHNLVEAAQPDTELVQTLVSCGRVAGGQRLMVVDPETLVTSPPGRIGEIWVAGPSIAQGYWNRLEQTDQVFKAFTADTGQGPFLRTGDLGFVQNNELYVTGRLKDLIIIRGRNHYPQDIERTVQGSHAALQVDSGAAFSVAIGGEERLVVVQEVERHSRNADVEEVSAAIRGVIADVHEIQVYAIVLIKPGSIPKTSSGKIQRHLCRLRFLAGQLEVVGSSLVDTNDDAALEDTTFAREMLLAQPPGERTQLLEAYLSKQIVRGLGAGPMEIDPNKPLNALGIDSLAAIELSHRIETRLQVVFPVVRLLEGITLAQLVQTILEQLDAAAPAKAVLSQQGGGTASALPLSQGQRALWYLYQLMPESAAYNIASAIQIQAEVDVAALQRAFQKLVDRHASLRSTFGSTQAGPFQEIHEYMPVVFDVEDTSSWEDADLTARMVAEAHRPFDLEKGPLLRVSVFKRSARNHRLLLVVHHIVADFWSFAVLVRELDQLYLAETLNVALQLPATQLYYADYVNWQAELLGGAEGDALWQYWRKQLAGELPVLELPTDKPRPPNQTFNGSSLAFAIDRALSQKLKQLAQAEGSTLYMVLLAAFDILLAQLSGQKDILVGSPAAARTRARLADVVGYFVNPIVLRANLSGESTVKEFLAQVRQVVLSGFEHQDYPFPLLVERLQPRRHPSYSPLFQVMFVLQRAQTLNGQDLSAFALGEAGATMTLGGLPVESFALEQQVAQFDLTLMMAESKDGLIASLQYNRDMFTTQTMEQVAVHFTALLNAIVSDPSLNVSNLPPPTVVGGGRHLAAHAEAATLAAPAEFVAPHTSMEKSLAKMWLEVLPIETIGVNDNFFDLGGHSLLATRIVARVRETLNAELSLRDFLESPTIASLAHRLVSNGYQIVETPNTMTQPQPPNDDFVLSPAQERMWFLDQLDPGSPVYNMSAGLRLKGTLNVEALHRSLNEIVRRHETLRTRFVAVSGLPQTVVEYDVDLPLPVTDLSASADKEADANRLAEEDAQKPFDLTVTPLLRTLLLRLSETDHLLVMTIHHIVSDGWSLAVLMRELTALYATFAMGQPSPLPDLPVQYLDYASWQRQWLSTEGALDEQLDYWKRHLSGGLPVLELPTDRIRPPVQSQSGDAYRFELSRSVVVNLHALSRAEGVTMFMLFLAALQTQLFRYTGQADQVMGTPIANRPRSELEYLIGLFVNTLVLRNDLSGDPTFRELLARVRETSLGAYAHQDVPFEKLVELVQVDRDMSHTPLFQVMLALQTPMPEMVLGDLNVVPIAIVTKTAKFDLTLFVEENGQDIDCAFEYNTDVFSEDTIVRFAQHFVQLLNSITQNPAEHLSELPLLNPGERQQVLNTWNAATAKQYPASALMHELFETTAARLPKAEALFNKGQSLSYEELNERANQLAHYLRAQGATSDTFVAVCMERDVDLIVALLGILKSGAAYVPLDPAYPSDRLAFMMSDTRTPILLTHEYLGLQLPWHEAKVVNLDTDWDEIAQHPATNPDRVNTDEHLGYIIYTSGSTGRPKGVALTHRGAVTLLRWAQSVYSAQELSRVLVSTSVCFDLSVFEIFLPLSAGGTIVLVDNALALMDMDESVGVTLVNTVPSAMTELLRLKGLPKSITTVNLAGEPLTRKLVDNIYATGTVARVYNLYGPSEDTTYSTFTLVANGETRAPTIGRPIANTQAYILDERMEPTPIGVPGELYLGGAGLARGYHDRPELTAEKFIPDLFSGAGGQRLYKTGDLARWLPDGQIDFLGRRDHQVKVRGFRIELGEVEAALARHTNVRDCIVVAREDVPGDKQLVGYVVAKNSPKPSVKELRDHIRTTLPEYMVPSVLMLMDLLPLTPNGKVDRKALPAPESKNEVRAEYVAPSTPVEEELVNIWTEVLSVERVGVNDNFFELGGHSLLATQIVARIRETFKVDLPLRGLFETPTVATLAQLIGTDRAPIQRVETPKIRAIPRGKKNLGDLLSELEQLSDDEVQALLARRAKKD